MKAQRLWQCAALLAAVATLCMIGLGTRVDAQNASIEGNGAQPLPPDVDPVSRMRLPPVKRADLDDYGKSVWDKVTDTPNEPNTPVTGPTGIRLYAPIVSEHMNIVNQYLQIGRAHV